jgi:hypothetical protein
MKRKRKNPHQKKTVKAVISNFTFEMVLPYSLIKVCAELSTKDSMITSVSSLSGKN